MMCRYIHVRLFITTCMCTCDVNDTTVRWQLSDVCMCVVVCTAVYNVMQCDKLQWNLV